MSKILTPLYPYPPTPSLDRQSWCVSPGLLEADTNGIIRSFVFPGLWLDAAALLTGEMTRVLAVLQQGLNSPEHEIFVQQLSNHF